MPPRLECYTEAELRSRDGPNLPGLWTPAQIDPADPYAFFRGTDWQPVLNLAVVTEEIRRTGEVGLRMLAGSRPESEPTHPNVVSTPTQWILDTEELELMLRLAFFNSHMTGQRKTLTGQLVNPQFYLNDINPAHYAVIGHIDPYPAPIGGVTLPLGRLTQKLLADKLGFEAWYAPDSARRLNTVKFYPSIGDVSLSRLLAGFSYVGDNADGEPLLEPIVTLGAVIHTPYPKLFPRSTSRYNNLTFTSLEDFAHNVKTRNVGNLITLDSELELVMMCVRGLCLATGSEMSSGLDLMSHLRGPESGVRYDPHTTTHIAKLLVERDMHGQRLADQTSEVLGYNAFPGPRVAFERVHADAIIYDHDSRRMIDLSHATIDSGMLWSHLLPIDSSPTFPARKR